jgi:predicted ribosome quality control (RQC) complex YloA/Tae2 family protein
MKKVIQIVSFELNDKNLLEEWKVMSAEITAQLKNAPGFIYRDSAIEENGKIYCVLKWESIESQKAVRKMMESPEMEEKMEAFGKIANLQTMEEKFLEVV